VRNTGWGLTMTEVRFVLVPLLGLAVTQLDAAGWKWHGPEPVIGVNSPEAPGATTAGPHDIDVILTGPNGHLYWQWPTATTDFTSPTDLGQVDATSSPSVVAGGRNRLDAFYRGKNGHLWTSWWDGTWWSGATDLGGLGLGGAPVAVANGIHRLDVFYVNSAGRLTLSYWDGGDWWSEPSVFPMGDVKGSVAAVTRGPHKLQVFYRGTDDRLWTFWSDGGPWSAPISLGTLVTGSPAATSGRRRSQAPFEGACTPLGQIALPCSDYAFLYYRSSTGALMLMSSIGGGNWSPAETTGLQVSDRIAAVGPNTVFSMGLRSPSGLTLSTATQRFFRRWE
jgi:hypothetical protein